MKPITLACFLAAVFFTTGICSAGAPTQIGGFVLGSKIEANKDRVLMETSLPIRYEESLQEVEIRPIAGFKSGLIAYGTCAEKGRIVRIKLKFSQSDRKFYDQLLDQYKRRFGEPDEWRGDPFHVVLAWKWSFTDGDGNRISLILSHNMMDTEEKMGNAVKMTLTNRIEEEDRCFAAQHPDLRKSGPGRAGSGKTRDSWELFIPR